MSDKDKKRFGRQPRLLVMIFMTSSFFLVEIVVGYITGSLALVADSFHMLSDVIALVVAFFAIRMAKKKTANKKNSYGWQRAETWGALVNGVFLLALCFTIVVEAIQRFFELIEIKDPKLVLIVGGVGLLINAIGLLMFAGVGGHGHSHGGGGGHGHSHGGAGDAKKGSDHGHSHSGGSGDHGHSHGGGEEDHGHSHSHSGSTVSLRRMDSELGTTQFELRLGETYKVKKDYTPSKPGYLVLKRGDDILVLENIKRNVYLGRVNGTEEGRIRTKHLSVPEFDLEDTTDLLPEDLEAEMPDLEVNIKKQTGGHNMKAAFLHVLGDALGSVGVIVASLIIWLTDVSWRFYFDPIISLLITGLIIYSTVPLVIDTSLIMLQGVPGFDFDNLRNSLKKLPGVKGVHEVHVWRLSDNNMVGSAHLMVENPKIRDRVSAHAKRVFHLYEVHSSTIQTEVLEANKSRSMLQVRELEDHSETACLLSCEKGCQEDGCCPKGEEIEVATA